MPENCPVEIKPFSTSGVAKPPQLFNLNYTNQDFYSMKTRLVNFLNERFGTNGSELPNTFNDLVESSIAIMLIENWAFLADTLSFKIDQTANEIFLDTVSQVENIFRLSRLVGFEPQPPIAARSMWTATMNNPLVTAVRLPTPISIPIVSEDRPTQIELFQADANNEPMFDEDIIIPAGSTVNRTIVGLEGRTIVEQFSGTGNTSQTFRLTSFPVISDSIRLQVDGMVWDQVKYFTDSQPRREYRVEFDSDWNGYIIFGNNRAGLSPSPGSNIRATYRIGGGTAGNIVTGYIETQTMATVPGLDFTVPISLRNYTKGEFGYNGDTIEDVRRKLPQWLRTQDRAVTGDDYKTLADQFSTAYHGQVGRSVAVLRNHGCAGNIIDLYVLAKDGSDGLIEATNELKVALNEELSGKKMMTDFVCIRDGVIVSVDTSIDVTIDKFYRKFELELRENITKKIAGFFSINRWEYGKTLKHSDLIKELSEIKEIQELDITFVTSDMSNSGTTVTTRFFEIIRPDQTTVSFIYN